MLQKLGDDILIIEWMNDSNNREVLWRGRLSTVDLLALTSLDQLLFILEVLLTFYTKHANLIRRSTVQSFTLS